MGTSNAVEMAQYEVITTVTVIIPNLVFGNY